MKNTGTRAGGIGRRILSAMLSLIMVISLLPAVTAPASAAGWMEPYLEKLASWGVMRGDSSGNMHPERAITRAEFVVLVNRALGYGKTSPSIPYKDVKNADWYYDDINIGYTTGYFKGTSKNSASPKNSVTREQAAVLLGRNLALNDDPGASMNFTDSNRLGTWSRGIVRSAVNEGIVHGYKDGSFKPKDRITRGQMAVLLVNAIGTPVNKSGTQTLGGVYGNVTISTSGVTLRDTTIAGNLYITGGLGLGDVALENVSVLGKIVVCGAGESSKGKNSVVLRNVTVPTLIMDSLSNNTVSIRAEGSTKVDHTLIRTPSYLEDAAGDNNGFLNVKVDGEDETTLSVAGNLKEIITLTPKSTVTVAKGSVKMLTVDEAAKNAAVTVLPGGTVKELNLDVGTAVKGTGDVEKLNVKAPGSKVEMLPDAIVIRPDITATIAGEKMDTTLAAESSADPRLLAGYPKVTDLAPTSAKGLMRTNKAGTVYWAITSITDGSVGEADLLKPTGNSKIIKSGNLKSAKSDTDYSAALSSLTSDGSYYLSAMMVDARNQHSPVKAISFGTPDNTVPNFATGYPYLSQITSTSAQVTVMPTKTCRLYYALLPKNAAAPTAKDFKANAVTGNLGFGSRDVTKNVTDTFRVNRSDLKELEGYDLYLWLTDVDGTQNSAVKKLAFTTVDGTPPKFLTEPTVTSIKETSVGMTASLNEIGTIYWVAVKEGDEYPKPMNGQASKPELTSEAAKLQVSNGMNALKSGKISAAANKDVSINISGLSSESAYDVYYLAQDKAGNYSAVVGKITIHTLDTNSPTVTQEFTRTNDAEGKSPLADSDVRIVFSENVQSSDTNQHLLETYAKSLASKDTSEIAALLRSTIQLYSADVTPAVQVVERTSDSITNWTIDYRSAKVTAKDGKVIVTFESGKALKLQSGSKYYFQIQNIADTSNSKNIIKPNPCRLETFTTVYAQVNLAPSVSSGTDASGSAVNFDMSFKVVPISTKNAAGSVQYDLLFRTASQVSFKLYTRTGESGNWTEANDSGTPYTASLNPYADNTVRGASYFANFVPNRADHTINFGTLNTLVTNQEFGVVFTSLNGSTERKNWNGKVEMQVRVVAGSNDSEMSNLTKTDMTDNDLKEYLAPKGTVTEVGTPVNYAMRCIFTDSEAPTFQVSFPDLKPSDVSAVMNVQLSRSSGKIFYVVAPVETIRTVLKNHGNMLITKGIWDQLPMTTDGSNPFFTDTPTSSSIMNSSQYSSNPLVKTGSTKYYGSTTPITLTGLEPETKYCAYFVLQGDSQNVYTESPYLFRFETTEISRPIIQLDINNPSVSINVNSTSTVDYLLAVNGQEPGGLRNDMANFSTSKSEFQSGGSYYGKGTGSPLSGGGKVYTVLDAMSENYYDGKVLKGSVFDQYASQSAKDQFAEYIRAQATVAGSITLKGQTDVPADSYKTVNCSSGMTGSTWYTFLSVAKSVSGSGDAFRAIRPVFNTDDQAPMISACNFVLQQDIGSINGPCNGTLTLLFDEDLYWVVKTGVNQEITPINNTTALDPSSNFFPAGIAFEPGLGSGISFSKGTATGVISKVAFTFNGARPGSSITASAQIGDKGGNVHTVPLNIVLAKYAKNEDGTFSPVFSITPSWDAIGKK